MKNVSIILEGIIHMNQILFKYLEGKTFFRTPQKKRGILIYQKIVLIFFSL